MGNWCCYSRDKGSTRVIQVSTGHHDYTLHVPMGSTVQQLKGLIKHETGISANRMHLYVSGRTLTPEDMLAGVDKLTVSKSPRTLPLSDDNLVGRRTWRELKGEAMKPDYRRRYWFVSHHF